MLSYTFYPINEKCYENVMCLLGYCPGLLYRGTNKVYPTASVLHSWSGGVEVQNLISLPKILSKADERPWTV